MAAAKKIWKKGRGKLGVLEPLIGTWVAEADSPMGRLKCTRTFSKFHGTDWILLDAEWKFSDQVYKEHAVYGTDQNGRIVFWSFTSDGKCSQGHLTEAGDIHPEAISFEA